MMAVKSTFGLVAMSLISTVERLCSTQLHQSLSIASALVYDWFPLRNLKYTNVIP